MKQYTNLNVGNKPIQKIKVILFNANHMWIIKTEQKWNKKYYNKQSVHANIPKTTSLNKRYVFHVKKSVQLSDPVHKGTYLRKRTIDSTN